VGAAQGSSASAQVQVLDASTIAVSWEAASTPSWLVTTPASGSTVNSAPATVSLNVSAAGLAPGSYTGTATISSTSRDLEMNLPVAVTFNVLSQPTLTANRSFPLPASNPIVFTASASGGNGHLEYQFWRYRSGGSWSMVQDYSSSNTFAWTPAVGDTGSYVIQVWVRSARSAQTWDAFASLGEFSITRPAPVMTAFTASANSPAAPGTPITFAAQSTGGIAPVQYKFWRQKSGGAWVVAQDWSAAATVTWTPGVADLGTYNLQAWVRNADSTDYDDWKSMTFTVSQSTPVIDSVTVNRPLPAPTLSPMTWTAVAHGGTSGPLQYRFWRYSAAAGAWTMVRDYGASNSWTWTPSDAEAGQYELQVWVRSAGSSASYEAYTATDMFAVRQMTAQLTGFGANHALPASAGTPITWTATANNGPVEYTFWRYSQSSGTWTQVQGWSSANTFTWTPGTGERGTYMLQVWVRRAGSTANYEDWASTGSFAIQ
jgi:hypothetical protein